ncbi:MAG: hypothetical protein L6R00_18825 [Phycisphaerae bacterium]|nr:hypothetical protein [Phycisphaerae bacterium]
MDAWGNLISPVYLDGLQPALPVDDVDCTASTAEGCEPADGMPQDEVLAGPYQYHGTDRYETDLIDMDKLLRPDGGQPDPGAGRSTGFVHVGVRYYEPATGRFLQHDPLFIDPTPFAWGQHNRWVYCANDPVNYRDTSGQLLQDVFGWMMIVGGIALVVSTTIFFLSPGAFFHPGLALAGYLGGLALMLKGASMIVEDPCLSAKLDRLANLLAVLAEVTVLPEIMGIKNAVYRAIVALSDVLGIVWTTSDVIF